MTVQTQAKKHFGEWEFTPSGSFRNATTNRILNRKDWEIEMAYEFQDNAEALAEARELAKRAEKLAPKV